MDVGFEREQVAYASVSPSRAGYTNERVGPYIDRVREELTRLPGVVRVSPVQTRLLSGGGNASVVNIPGHPPRIEKGIGDPRDYAHLNSVGDGFFEALSIPVIAGRTIAQADMRPDADAVVVDELFAKRFFPNENPLGRRFGLGIEPQGNTRYEIVGIVGNSRYNSLRNDLVPTVYEPYRPGGTIHFAIRASGDPAALAERVRKAIASVDPAVPLTEFHTQSGLIDRLLRTERVLGFLSAVFGLVALTLTAVGLGGLLAYAVARRTNEIGVRIALGATASDVIRLVLRDSAAMVGTGVFLGLPCVFVIASLLRTALFRLEPLDPRTTVLAFVALFAVALLSAWVPARRAARIDPIDALREE
jgi:predicted permease